MKAVINPTVLDNSLLAVAALRWSQFWPTLLLFRRSRLAQKFSRAWDTEYQGLPPYLPQSRNFLISRSHFRVGPVSLLSSMSLHCKLMKDV